MRVDAPRTREVRMPLHIKAKKYKVTSLQSGFLVAIIVLFIDQGSKLLVTAQAEILRDGMPIFPGLNFVFIQNAGVSFGLFGFAPPLVLIIFGILICCILVIIIYKNNDLHHNISCGMIIGGALGNIIDRIRHGWVTDFIDVYVGQFHWPSFNMADVTIVTGAIILSFGKIFFKRKEATR